LGARGQQFEPANPDHFEKNSLKGLIFYFLKTIKLVLDKNKHALLLSA